MNIASIDIGTNTILLLIAEIEGGNLKPLFEREAIVRLGEGVQKTGIISSEAMERGLQTLTQYLERCQEMDVQQIFAVGTSALREAKNSEVFLKLIKEKLDLSIEIISGEKEAYLSFLSVARDINNPAQPIIVIDIGGGSTEFIIGKGTTVNQWKSLPLGSVRLTEKYLHSDPVQNREWNEMETEVQQLLSAIPRSEEKLTMVAVAGTATTLASVELKLEKFYLEKIHHFVLMKEALRNQLSLYRSKTLDERKKIPGLPPSRADVILAGATILYMAMEKLGCPSALISCHGVRYGLLYEKMTRTEC